MSIDATQHEPIQSTRWLTLAQAARTLPTHPAPATLWRWARKGVRGVFLEYQRLGGRIVVTPEAIRAFMAELTRRDRRPAPVSVSQPAEANQAPTPARRNKADLEARLREEGLW